MAAATEAAKQVGAIELLGAGAHGGHAGVVHGNDPQAEAHRRLQVVARQQLLAAQGVHGHPAGQQHDQQRDPGQGHVVVNLQRRLQGQHADEVHGPDAASQTAGAEQAPLPLGRGLLDVAQALGHVEGGEAAGTGDQKGKQHQVGVVPAIEKDLSGCRKFGEHLQPQPLHSMPLFRVGTRPPIARLETVVQEYRNSALVHPE